MCHGSNLSLGQMFTYHTQTLATVDGIKNCFAVVLAGLVRYVLVLPSILQDLRLICRDRSAGCMCLFVERAKKCLDFGVTLFFIDFLVQCFYSVRLLPNALIASILSLCV